jgi:hypothetical protein
MMFRSITLQEANVFLPLIKDHFVKIHTLVAEGQMLQESMPKSNSATQETAQGTMQEVCDIPQKPKSTSRQKLKRLKEIESEIRDEVLEMHCYGAIVKSVFPARIDFLSELHRQPIYLCWQSGDKAVSHWHSVDESFTSRKPIQHPQSFGPLVVH